MAPNPWAAPGLPLCTAVPSARGPESCRLTSSSATRSCERPLPTHRPRQEALATPLVGSERGGQRGVPLTPPPPLGPGARCPALSTPRGETCSSPRPPPRPSLQWNPGSGPGRGSVSCNVRLGGLGGDRAPQASMCSARLLTARSRALRQLARPGGRLVSREGLARLHQAPRSPSQVPACSVCASPPPASSSLRPARLALPSSDGPARARTRVTDTRHRGADASRAEPH